MKIPLNVVAHKEKLLITGVRVEVYHLNKRSSVFCHSVNMHSAVSSEFQ